MGLVCKLSSVLVEVSNKCDYGIKVAYKIMQTVIDPLKNF